MSRKFWITVAEIDKKKTYWTWSKQRILKKCLDLKNYHFCIDKKNHAEYNILQDTHALAYNM